MNELTAMCDTICRLYAADTGNPGKISASYYPETKTWVFGVGRYSANGDTPTAAASGVIVQLTESVRSKRQYHTREIASLDEVLGL